MRVLLDECLPNLDALLKKTTDEASRPAQSARRAGNSLWSRLSIQKQFSTRKVERIGKAMQTFDRARRRGNFAEMQESVQRAIERKAAGDGEILFARLRTRIDALHEERRDGPARSGHTDSLHIKRFRARRWACDLCALRPKEVLPE